MAHLAEGKYMLLKMTQRVVSEALRLTFSQALRAYDAIQLATSLVAITEMDRDRFVFVTSDEKLEAIAVAQGLQAENPLKH